MKRTFLFLLEIIILSGLYANDSIKLRTNLLGIQTGYGFYRYVDLLESAAIYGGPYIPLNFNWITYSEKHIDEFSFSYSKLSLKSRVSRDINLTDFNAMYFNLNYGYHLTVLKLKKIYLYGGAKLYAYMDFRDLNYYIIPPVNNTFTNQSMDLFATFNLSVVSRFDLTKCSLFIRINSSLFGYVTNRRYDINQDSESDLLFFPRFSSFGFNSYFYYKITPIIFLNLGYQYYYYSYPRSQDLFITKGGNNQVVVGLNFKI